MKDNRGHNRFNSVTNIATTLLKINTFATVHHKSVSIVMMSMVDSGPGTKLGVRYERN